jgi:hypothetical protein
MIEQTASFTAAETIARLRVSRGGLNGPAAVVRSAMMFHVVIAWTSALRTDALCEGRAGTTVGTTASFTHADTPPHRISARPNCVAVLLVDDVIPASR